MQKPWNNFQRVSIQLFLMSPTQQLSKNTAISWRKWMFCSMLLDGFHTDLFLTRLKKNGTNVWIWMSRVCLEWNGSIYSISFHKNIFIRGSVFSQIHDIETWNISDLSKAQGVLPSMLKAESGSIINMSSVASSRKGTRIRNFTIWIFNKSKI